ncbi:hypothetical protein I3843_03G116100 [Carya illinoinensis]|nr:hypothetical protein I3843_03G116100 [Carya illinoinensis]
MIIISIARISAGEESEDLMTRGITTGGASQRHTFRFFHLRWPSTCHPLKIIIAD